jgi:MFS family permease
VGRFAAAGLVNALGTGFFYPFSLLFFVDRTGLALATVGLVLSTTTLGVLPALFVVGRLADRWGPLPVLVTAALVRAGCFTAFAAHPGLLAFVLLSAVLALATRAEQTAFPLLAVTLAPQETREQWLALSRVVFNIGMGGGALLAGLLVGTGSGYRGLGLLNALGCLLTVVCYVGLPRAGGSRAKRPPTGATGATRAMGTTGATGATTRRARPPYRDTGFLRIALVNALLWAVALATESALPVFAVRDAALPTWSVGLLFTVNTVLMSTLQLPVGRLLLGKPLAAVVAVGALLYAVLHLGAALLPDTSEQGRIAVLVVAMTVYTLGEVAVSQGTLVQLTTWPPEHARGSYLAFNQVLVGVATASAPLLATSLPTAGPGVLWWVLAGLCVLAAALSYANAKTGTTGTTGTPEE